ncbi:MAG: DUF5678 domain-containing protein [Bryobacteraceae bacterium]
MPHLFMKLNPRTRQPRSRQPTIGFASCLGILDSSGSINMRNTGLQTCLLGVRRGLRRHGRKRKSAPLRLAEAGRRVDIAAGIQRRSKASTENGRRPLGTSLRLLEREWLRRHEGDYAGEWVAIQGARLVGHGSSAQQALDAAKSAGFDQPLLVHLPSEPQLPFAGW